MYTFEKMPEASRGRPVLDRKWEYVSFAPSGQIYPHAKHRRVYTDSREG